MYNFTLGLKATNKIEWSSAMKTIKSIRRHRFAIRLIETESGAYRVCYTKGDAEEVIGESLSDYSLAALVFDITLIKLEGN